MRPRLCDLVGPDTVSCTLLWPVTWCCKLRICVGERMRAVHLLHHSQVFCGTHRLGRMALLRADEGDRRAAAPGCRGHRAVLQSLCMQQRSTHGTAAACGRGLWCSAALPWQCEVLGSALPALEAPHRTSRSTVRRAQVCMTEVGVPFCTFPSADDGTAAGDEPDSAAQGVAPALRTWAPLH